MLFLPDNVSELNTVDIAKGYGDYPRAMGQKGAEVPWASTPDIMNVFTRLIKYSSNWLCDSSIIYF